ncbi:hypothetical protein SS1G_02892 [Sclerotinia sclerotiorum 1980 UF-70]|uniref:Uncharacterized protein n=2 Tax=Sclerotinia sclerotiorum (strain ATCC 18683 / 1980 / Ss-1) TaxID=665079 RepID=A7EC54_SCLS1|nr:hypothetical protein SS1G_02892 [Sclerotinia sclerotiorum 1980 UF-70]APA09022.1 hypothetical protein sscle_04g037920 [Sclerotinia sclerotiorum 1980 UF-70]EDO00033.1 hypothetical protein SS1G_02892 [Sclerotinia sclerotiorum 1980 UF-70]
MSKIGKENTIVAESEEQDRVISGVGEEDQDSVTKARHSNVRYSRNMTIEQLLESLKKLTGPGAEDERKRRVMVYTQREKNPRREAKDQAWSKERKARAEMTQIRQQARLAEKKAKLEVKKAEVQTKEAKAQAKEAEAQAKEVAKKARMAVLDAREMGFQTPIERKELKKIAKWGRYKARKEANSKSNCNMVEPREEADVDTMKTGEEVEGATFQLPIREK